MLQWNVTETAEQDILTHALKPSRPSMKHKLLHWFTLIFVGIKPQIKKN